jgi:hypothetical protein
MTTQEALERAKQLAQERKALREAGFDRIKELVDTYGEIVLSEPVPIAADVVVAVRYGKWKAAWLPNEPYKDDYLVVFESCRGKHHAWPLRGNINTPNEAWRIVEAIEKAVNE